MALNEKALELGLVKLQKGMIKKTVPSYEEYAKELTALISAFVRSGDVVIQSGIPVSTTGSAAAQTGTTTSTGTGKVN